MAEHDPTRTSTRVARAEAEYRRRMGEVRNQVTEYIHKEYNFELDEQRILTMGEDIRAMVDAGLIDDVWLFSGYVKPVYTAGVARAHAALSAQSPAYRKVRGDIGKLIMSPPYQHRIGLARARVFEEMENFAGPLGDKLAATLARGVANGFGYKQVAADIKQNFDVTQYRAERIARTEITSALNRALMDESEDTELVTGFQTVLMHVSAFAPTSRHWHIMRHGTLHTPEAQRLWWSMDANSINCLCTVIPVMIGRDGKPLAPGILARAAQLKQRMTE